MVVSSIRAAILFMGLAMASCLPNVVADWLFPVYVAGSFTQAADIPLDEDSAFTTLESHQGSLQAAPAEEAEPGPPQMYDVRGNEIVLPVARYGIDDRGSLYELHSPHTELPKLEPPEL